MFSKIDILVTKFCNGHAQSFDEIYALTNKLVFLSIQPYVKNSLVIEDLMQETYMKALQSLASYQSGTNFKAWLCKIAQNKALDYVKKNKEILVDEEHNLLESKNKSSLLMYQIEKALDKVEYKVFIYHSLLDFSYKDIARMFEMDHKNVAYIYAKAKNKLKIALGGIS